MTTGLFNDKGEMNATSVADAVSNLAKYASVIQNHMGSSQALAGKPSYTEQKRMRWLSEHFRLRRVR